MVFGNRKITHEKDNLFLELFFASHRDNINRPSIKKMNKFVQNFMNFLIGFFSTWLGLSFLCGWID